MNDALALVLIGTRGAAIGGAQTATPAAGVGGVADPATADASSPFASDAAARYDEFLAKLAANLGIADPAAVDRALRDTLKQEVDESAAAGELSTAEAEAIKARIDAAEMLPVAGLAGPRGGWGGPSGGRHGGRGDGRHGDRDGFDRDGFDREPDPAPGVVDDQGGGSPVPSATPATAL